jgi:flagellar assembly protein FliH
VATAIGRKVLPHLYALQGSSEVDRIVAQILPKVLEEGPIVIRVPSALVAELSPLLLGTAAKQGIADGLRIVGDDDLPAGDCRVEWPGGGAVRSAEQLWREIDQVIEDQLSSAGFLGFTGSAIQSDSLKV